MIGKGLFLAELESSECSACGGPAQPKQLAREGKIYKSQISLTPTRNRFSLGFAKCAWLVVPVEVNTHTYIYLYVYLLHVHMLLI